MEADLVVGVGLLPVAALSLREVRHVRELLFAALPLLFAGHQLVEALVWAGQSGDVSSALAHAATVAYILVALPLLPTLVPVAVLMLEPRGSRRRVAGFVGLGLVVTAYLGWAVLRSPVEVTSRAWALEYHVSLDHGIWWAVLYIIAVIGPSLMSGYPSVIVFGVVNLAGLTAAAVLYIQAFASLWCVLAAISSGLVLVHMRRRRRLSDPHRLSGIPG